MYCAKCGNQIADKAKFCPECGAKLEVEAAEEVVKAEAAKAEEIEREEVKAEAEEIMDAEIVEEKAEASQEPAASDSEVKPQTENEDESKADGEINSQAEAADISDKPEKSTTDTVKDKLEEAVEDAKKAGKDFAESDAVQNAKKEVHSIINEAKVASELQGGKAAEGETVVPRQEVSFLVDWLYWTGRRSRMKYLLICILTSVCSLALGATGILSLLFCYVSAVNLVKRLHDFDKPGWYAFLLMFAEYVIINLTWIFGLLGAGLAVAGATSGLLLWLVPLLLIWGIKLWVFTVPGTKGSNRFGPEPEA